MRKAFAQVLWTKNLAETTGDTLGPDSQVASIAFLQELEALSISATGGELLLVHTSREVQEVKLLPAPRKH